ncbi:MAG: response regulator [Dehalococcoidales bacterium]
MKNKHTVIRILLIEDEPDIQSFIHRVLELEGYDVLKTGDGQTGLEMVRKYPVSLVLLDLRVPGLDGWGVLREMKRDAELARIPVVVLTAVAETSQRRRTMSMGAARYLIKPLSANGLSQTIADILNKKGSPIKTAPEKAPPFHEMNVGY